MSEFPGRLILCGLYALFIIYTFNYFINVNTLIENTKKRKKVHFKLPFTLDNQYNNKGNEQIDEDECSHKPFACKDSNCDCTKICRSKKFELIEIEDDVIYNGIKLKPGRYCLNKNKKNNCLAYTSISIFYKESNSWYCLCKYPQIFNGKFCSEFVACKIPYKTTDTLLWDYKTNEKIDIFNLKNYDFNELIPGTRRFRYRCKCDGFDFMGNKVIKFDFEPFKCFSDPCKDNVRFSSVPGFNDELMECDCGEFEKTRQKNVTPNNKQSYCSPCFTNVKDDVVTIPTRCFNDFNNPTDYEYNFYPCVNFKIHVNNCALGKITYFTELNDDFKKT